MGDGSHLGQAQIYMANHCLKAEEESFQGCSLLLEYWPFHRYAGGFQIGVL